MNFSAPDLSLHPPRSPRVRLGGYALLPRLLDKCRAEIAGTPGAYHYNCPLDQQFFMFVGLEADRLKEQVATGLGDGDLLIWINDHAANKRTPWEIAQWSVWRDAAGPAEIETRDFFNSIHKDIAAARTDIVTWNELLDLDDFASFGGKV